MIHLDTSVLIDALTGPRRSAGRLREFIEEGERLFLDAVVFYDFDDIPSLRLIDRGPARK